MSNSIQDLIQQLKKIDVAELLVKAKTVKFDDVKKLKLSDILAIRNNKYFYPVTGILFASLITAFSNIPSSKSMLSIIEKSRRYSYQAQNFEILEEKLSKNRETLNKFNSSFSEVSDLVIKPETLIYLTRIIDESAKRSLIKISQFRPINPQELESCSSLTEEERAGQMELGFSNSMDNMDNFGSVNDDFVDDLPMDDMSMDIDGIEQGITNEEIDSVLFSQEINNNYLIDNPLSNIEKDLDRKYTSNYFEIRVEADYLNIMNFMRSIQEYQAFIIPYCFQPRVTSNEGSMEFNQVQNMSGQVQAKIIINIPTNL